MSNYNDALQRLGLAVEESKRAFGLLAVELEIFDGASKQLRRENAEGIEREAELRDLLRDRGLASYDGPPTDPNHGRRSDDTPET